MRDRSNARAGFTMIEAVVAVALTAMIVMAMFAIASQWLPNWRRGFEGLQKSDLLSVALNRMSEDLSAAEYVTPSNDAHEPLFEGDAEAVTFIRSAMEPDSFPHLEVVRFARADRDGGPAMSRMRAAFAPFPPGPGARGFHFGDEVALIRAPLRVAFAYAGADRVWVAGWRGRPLLPEAVRISVRNADGTLAASTAVRLRVTARGAPTLEAQAAPKNVPETAAPLDAPPAGSLPRSRSD